MKTFWFLILALDLCLLGIFTIGGQWLWALMMAASTGLAWSNYVDLRR